MSFVEITSGNNWFELHPEKVAGVEVESNSFYFPLRIKGTKEDVLRVTGFGKKTDNKRIRIAKAKAKALKLKL